MTLRASNAILAYWLVPAEPARTFFTSTIAELASRFDAPLFESHMTVHASRKGGEDPKEVLSGALAGYEPFGLSVRSVERSDEFTKTVFVQFEPSAELSRLGHALKKASAHNDEYELNPHLSLIYKRMTPELRAEVANSIRVPFTEVTFDFAKAIVGPRPIRSREDVESWRVVASQRLTK